MDIHVFSLNCWGLLGVSKNRRERFVALADVLASGKYHIVCLQEVWLSSDYQLLKDKVSKVLPHAYYFFSGVIGSGCCVFSAYPILDTCFCPWMLNGYPQRVYHGDWFGGKGVGLARIQLPNGEPLHVYNMHLHAEYNHESDEYLGHRVAQALTVSQFVRMTSICAARVVVCGDFNGRPHSLTMRLILALTGLTDTCCPKALREGRSEEPLEVENVFTCDHPLNSFSPTVPAPERIDYILISRSALFDVKTFCLPLPFTIPGRSVSYSDHEAISACLHCQTPSSEFKNPSCEWQPSLLENEQTSILREAQGVCLEALQSLGKSRLLYGIWALLFLAVFAVLPFMKHLLKTDFPYFITAESLSLLGLVYAVLMGALWNRMEQSGLKSALAVLSLHLKHTQMTGGVDSE